WFGKQSTKDVGLILGEPSRFEPFLNNPPRVAATINEIFHHPIIGRHMQDRLLPARGIRTSERTINVDAEPISFIGIGGVWAVEASARYESAEVPFGATIYQPVEERR